MRVGATGNDHRFFLKDSTISWSTFYMLENVAAPHEANDVSRSWVFFFFFIIIAFSLRNKLDLENLNFITLTLYLNLINF